MALGSRTKTDSHRNRYSLYSAISAMCLTLANGLLTIVATRFILSKFGSDFNGLNSTANQIVNVLLILEGGFTLASNVALYPPVINGDYDLVNGILSATNKKFRKISAIFFFSGVVISISYAFFVNSGLPRELIATIILMAIVPAAFNLFYAATYRVLLQSQQKEYIINIITMITVATGHVINIIIINFNCPMWMVRFTTMFFAVISSFLIRRYVRQKCKFIDLKTLPRENLIKGTNDVMAQKITGVIYESAPIIFLSISPIGGTVLASVYAVYNSVFIMLKSLLRGLIDAPRHAFGQILAERDVEDVWPVYSEYEYLSFMAIFTLIVTGAGMILPFIKLYTEGISDAEYYDPIIALLMVLIATLELIHIPSGHLINMAGKFRISRNFQVFSCFILIIGMFIGGSLLGVYGMLLAILLVAALLAFLEMGYIHVIFFKHKAFKLIGSLLPLFISGTILILIEIRVNFHIADYFSFVKWGIFLVIINSVGSVIVGLLFNRQQVMGLFGRVKKIVGK